MEPATIAPLHRGLAIPVEQTRVLEKIDRNIHNQDFSNAIAKVLHACLDLKHKDLAYVDELSSRFITLIPKFDPKSLEGTTESLNQLLIHSSHHPQNQFFIALAIGKAIASYSEHRAMLFFAKAITIAQENKLNEYEAHQQASKLFLKVIEKYLNSYSDREISSWTGGTVGYFGQWLDAFTIITPFCTDAEDDKKIRNLFQKLQSIFVQIRNKPFGSKYNVYAERVQKGLPPFSHSVQYKTQIYHDELKKFRKTFNSVATNLRVFQKERAEGFKKYLKILIDDAFKIMGPAPCKYDIRAMGSIAKDEVCPYSDLEFMIIIQDISKKEYFIRLVKILELQVACLNETESLDVVFTCLKKHTKSGLHIDTGGNPSLVTDLIGTPESLLKIQNLPISPNSHANTVLKTTSLKCDDPKLFVDYQERINNLLKEKCKERGLALLKSRCEDLEKAVKPSSLPAQIDLKRDFSQFLNYLMTDLSIYFHLDQSNSLDILQAVLDKGIFNAKSGILLKQSLEVIYKIRLRLHEYYLGQNETLALDGSIGLRSATNDERKWLNKIYFLVLKPLAIQLRKSLTTSFEISFREINLLDIAFTSWLKNPPVDPSKTISTLLFDEIKRSNLSEKQLQEYLKVLPQEFKESFNQRPLTSNMVMVKDPPLSDVKTLFYPYYPISIFLSAISLDEESKDEINLNALTSLPPSFQSKAPLNRFPHNFQELTSVIWQLEPQSPYYKTYKLFALKSIEEFKNTGNWTLEYVQNLVFLIFSQDQDITLSVMINLYEKIRLNFRDLRVFLAVADGIDRADPSHLNADQLWSIIQVLANQLSDTLPKGAEESQEVQLKCLIRVLNAMVDVRKKNIPRSFQEALFKKLNLLSKSDSIKVRCLAAYASEALKRIPNDESKLAAFFRISVGFTKGIIYLVAAIGTLNPKALFDGFQALQGSVENAMNFAHIVKDHVTRTIPYAIESVQAIASTASTLNYKFDWYEQMRYLEMLINAHSFAALESILLNPAFKKEPRLMCILVERLHEVALSHPVLSVRLATLELFQSLYQNEKEWGCPEFKDDDFKDEKSFWTKENSWIWLGIKGAITAHLETYSQIALLKKQAREILDELIKHSDTKQEAFIHRYQASKEGLTSASVEFAQVPLELQSEKSYQIELKLERIRNVNSKFDNDLWYERKIFDEVSVFLEEDAKILLLTGPSGTGKSFFCDRLAKKRWETYIPENGMIPIYINLDYFTRNSDKLILKAFKKWGFTSDEINLLKKRKILFILDFESEIPTENLIDQNQLGEWIASKVIVVCRNHSPLSSSLFIPTIAGRRDESLLKILDVPLLEEADIDGFIRFILDPSFQVENFSVYKKYMEEIPELKELARHPYWLRLFIRNLSTILEKNRDLIGNSHLFIRNSINKIYLETLFEQEAVRASHRQDLPKGLTLENVKKKALTFCQTLAQEMKAQNTTEIKYKKGSDETWKYWLKNAPKANYLRKMAPLKSTSKKSFSFIFPSLLEYLADPDHIFKPEDNLIEFTLTKDHSLFNRALNPTETQELVHIAKVNKTFKKELWHLMEDSKTNHEAALNALKIWNLARFPFAKINLSNAYLPDAYLEGANLCRTDLTQSVLNNANLSGALLYFTKIDEATMDDIRMGQRAPIEAPEKVSHLLFSSQQNIMIGSCKNEILIWKEGQLIKKLQGHTMDIEAMSLSLNEDRLVSCEYNKIYIWNLKNTAEEPRVFEVKIKKGINNVLFMGNGEKCAFLDEFDHEEVKILNLKTKSISTFSTLIGIDFIFISLDENTLAIACANNKIEIWDISSLQKKQTLKVSSSIKTMASMHAGKKIAVGCYSETIRILDIETGQEEKIIETQSEMISVLPFDRDTKIASFGWCDKSITIWDVVTGKMLKKLDGHRDFISAMCKVGNHLASTSGDQLIQIWEPICETIQHPITPLPSNIDEIALTKSKAITLDLQEKSLWIWNMRTGALQSKIDGIAGDLKTMTLLRKATQIATGGQDTTIRIWDLKSGSLLAKREDSKQGIVSMIAIDDHTLACGQINGGILILDLEDSSKKKNLAHLHNSIRMLVAQNGKLASLGSNSIVVWDIATGNYLYTKAVHLTDAFLSYYDHTPKGILSLCFLKNATLIAFFEKSNHTSFLKIWDFKADKIIAEIEDKTLQKLCLVPMLQGAFLATGGSDGTIRLWNIPECKQLIEIDIPFAISNMSFDEDKKLLIAGDNTGRLWSWKFNFDKPGFEPELLWVTRSTLACQGVGLGQTDMPKSIRDLLLSQKRQ